MSRHTEVFEVVPARTNALVGVQGKCSLTESEHTESDNKIRNSKTIPRGLSVLCDLADHNAPGMRAREVVSPSLQAWTKRAGTKHAHAESEFRTCSKRA